MRVIASVVAISCQLDAHVPVRQIADDLVPGFSIPTRNLFSGVESRLSLRSPRGGDCPCPPMRDNARLDETGRHLRLHADVSPCRWLSLGGQLGNPDRRGADVVHVAAVMDVTTGAGGAARAGCGNGRALRYAATTSLRGGLLDACAPARRRGRGSRRPTRPTVRARSSAAVRHCARIGHPAHKHLARSRSTGSSANHRSDPRHGTAAPAASPCGLSGLTCPTPAFLVSWRSVPRDPGRLGVSALKHFGHGSC